MSVTINGTTGLAFGDGTTQNTAPNGFGFKNRIINGAMMIDQRNAGASVSTGTTNNYNLDRWQVVASQNSKCTVQQNAGSVTPPAGFKNYLGVTSSSAYSVLATDFFWLAQTIEAFNTADLQWGSSDAKTVTLSFWVRSSLTGTFGGGITNSSGSSVASTRQYPFTYTISSANTWEQKTITIPGDTTGSWNGATNGIGVAVIFGLGVGSNFTAAAGSWGGASNVYTATGATSVVGTNGATFYITGVQLEKGSTATSFDYRPYGVEEVLCKRYTWVATSDAIITTIGSGASQAWCQFLFPITMRATPSVSFSGQIGVSDQVSADIVCASPAVVTNQLTSVGGRLNVSGFASALASYRTYNGTTYAGSGSPGKIILSAEL